MKNNYAAAYDFIKNKIDILPELGLILGSGLGAIGDEVENAVYINYSDIPGFPQSTVAGHKGRFVIGMLEGKSVIIMQGRLHYYEGHDMSKIVMPVRVMKMLGVKKLLVTNAAGGVNESFNPGDLMIIEDHINFSGNNPLIGENDDEMGARFPDMSFAYSKDIRKIIKECAAKININIRKGVYAMMTGPSFETPAEIRMLRILGADAVGMSTVPEVITANHSGIEAAGISCITNMAAGILNQALTHEEVMETGEKIKKKFSELIHMVISEL